MQIRPVRRDDAATWQRLRLALWPADAEEHVQMIERYFAGGLPEPLEVLLACREFAADTEIENVASARAHLTLGFEETGVTRCFRKSL